MYVYMYMYVCIFENIQVVAQITPLFTTNSFITKS